MTTVKAHTRKTKSGKATQVRSHSRQKRFELNSVEAFNKAEAFKEYLENENLLVTTKSSGVNGVIIKGINPLKLTKTPDFRKRLEEKYKKEVLFGATYIDSRQRNHFRKWVKEQNKKKMR